MQINFTPEKLKEANAYVDNLKPTTPKSKSSKKEEKKPSFFKRIFNAIFK